MVVVVVVRLPGGLGQRLTDRMNNIVKECCILDDWRKNTLVPVYRGKDGSNEPLILFSSCDKFRRGTKQRRRSCTLFLRIWVWMSGSKRCNLQAISATQTNIR